MASLYVIKECTLPAGCLGATLLEGLGGVPASPRSLCCVGRLGGMFQRGIEPGNVVFSQRRRKCSSHSGGNPCCLQIKALEHLGQVKQALTEVQAINREQPSDETREIEKRLKEAVAGEWGMPQQTVWA